MHAPATSAIIDPELLLLAYRSGIFPMADRRDDPEIFWVEPRRRAVLPLDGFHLSHSLTRTLRRDRFVLSCNAAFAEVMEACAAPRRSDSGESWISHRIKASYQRLHELGHAHSIECWRVAGDGERVFAGGLYGVGFDGAFCGESMFSTQPDASKVALAFLVAALRRAGAELLDCQFLTPHLVSLGAVEITQHRYLRLLRKAQGYSAAGGVGAGAGLGGPAAAGGAGDRSGDGKRLVLALPEACAALLAEAEASSSSPGNFIAHCLSQTS
ncbi:MAG: leucyl/phenylalanyl-tRNA--protein transferase [Novosphingobium sp.]